MTNQSVARRLLAEMVSRKEEEIELARSALLFAKEEYPGLDVGKYLQKLELMAEEIKSRIGNNTDPHFLISEINRYLFTEEGFRGNEDDYYDPRNSFLNDVLDRKTGIPITLSVLYIEIASRLGLILLGVGFPGHFIVKYSGIEKQILSRMLHNLKGIYLNSKNYIKALSIVDMVLLIDPLAIDEIRDRGLLYYNLECFTQALSDLETYLRHATKAEDAELIRGYIPVLKGLTSKIS